MLMPALSKLTLVRMVALSVPVLPPGRPASMETRIAPARCSQKPPLPAWERGLGGKEPAPSPAAHACLRWTLCALTSNDRPGWVTSSRPAAPS